MSKAVLISIQPKWCELIALGKKTVEVRKTRPKLEPPFKCYIYCTIDKRLLRKFDKGERIDDEHFFDEHVFVRQNTWIRGHLNPNQKVIGEFVCDRIEEIGFSPEMHGQYICRDQSFIEQSCVPFDEMFDYLDEEYGYGWHFSNLVIYGKPKELSEFEHTKEYVDNIRNSVVHWECGVDDEVCRPIRKAPQSWCYVEERSGNEHE